MRFDFGVAVKLKDAYRAQHEPEAQRVLAGFVWSALMVLLMVSLALSVGFGVWQFLQPLPPVAESVSTARKVFTKSDLQKILDAFESRAREYDARRSAPSPVKDPS